MLSRQMQLTSSFRDKEDAEGVELCKNLDTEEALSDIKAVIELKYPEDASESVKPAGRKMPVRQSRYKVCMQAGLHKLVSNFCSPTYAHVCSRMLTYAHVCSRMLTYAAGEQLLHHAQGAESESGGRQEAPPARPRR